MIIKPNLILLKLSVAFISLNDGSKIIKGRFPYTTSNLMFNSEIRLGLSFRRQRIGRPTENISRYSIVLSPNRCASYDGEASGIELMSSCHIASSSVFLSTTELNASESRMYLYLEVL